MLSETRLQPSQNFEMLGVLKIYNSYNGKKNRFMWIVYSSALIQQVILENWSYFSMYTDCGEICLYLWYILIPFVFSVNLILGQFVNSSES